MTTNDPANVGLPPEGTGRVKYLGMAKKAAEDLGMALPGEATPEPPKPVREPSEDRIRAFTALGLVGTGGAALSTGVGLWLGFPFALVTIGTLMVLVGIMVGRD